MRQILLLFLLGLSCIAGHAQSGELYFSFTPIEEPNYNNWTEGIYKSVDDGKDPLYKTAPVFFYLKSVSKGIHFSFGHINYNKAELAKRNLRQDWDDEMEITTTGTNIASYHTVYDLDSYLKAYTRDQLIDWLDSLGVEDDKKIYFFDKRDYDKGKITLIQVKFLDYGGGY